MTTRGSSLIRLVWRSRSVIALICVSCEGGSCDEEHLGPTDNGKPCGSALEIVAGDGQEAQAGSSLKNELVVRAMKTPGPANCTPSIFGGAELAWTAGDGALAQAAVLTDASGEARARWTLGQTIGSQTVTVRWTQRPATGPVVVATATFSAIGLSTPYHALRKVAGDAQTGQVSARLTSAPQIELLTVRDAGPQQPKRESLMQGVLVDWAVTAGGGTVESSQITTGGNGRASRDWTLGPTPGPQSLRVSTNLGLAPDPRDTLSVDFTATALDKPVASVVLTPATDITLSVGGSAPVRAQTFMGSPLVEALGRSVSWRSSNPGVATVAPTDGQSPSLVTVRAIGQGTADITATSEGKSATVRLTVTAAATRQRIAYGLADQPQTPSYTAARSFNSMNGPITVARVGQGVYRVTFAGQAPAALETETVMVSAYGYASFIGYSEDLASYYCKLGGGWSALGVDLVAEVRCFSFDGSEMDAPFSITLLGDHVLQGRFGFALADQPSTSGPYTPSKSYNSGGLNPPPVSVSRSATGTYVVTFPQNAAEPKAIHVAAVGSNNTRCNVAGPAQATVTVRCYAPPDSARLVDAAFAITLLSEGRGGTARAGFVLAVDGNDEEFETPGVYTIPSPPSSSPRAYNSSGGAVEVTKLASDGSYEVTFRGLAPAGSSPVLGVQVVDRDSDEPLFCNVAAWAIVGTDLKVSVQCLDFKGQPEDEGFYLIVIQ